MRVGPVQPRTFWQLSEAIEDHASYYGVEYTWKFERLTHAHDGLWLTLITKPLDDLEDPLRQTVHVKLLTKSLGAIPLQAYWELFWKAFLALEANPHTNGKGSEAAEYLKSNPPLAE